MLLTATRQNRLTEKNPELSVVAHVLDDKTFTVTTKEALGDKVFV
jgi:hypothetical protein